MTTRRRWTDETIAAELAPIVAELGRMPKREELAARGLSGLWSAIQRNGGVSAWRERMEAKSPAVTGAGSAEPPADTSLAAAPAQAAPAADTTPAVTHEDIARRAYAISQERGGDDVANWLDAERELTN